MDIPRMGMFRHLGVALVAAIAASFALSPDARTNALAETGEASVNEAQLYAPALPADIARRAETAVASFAQQMQQTPPEEVVELRKLFDDLGRRRSRERAYQHLLKVMPSPIPVGIDCYLKESDVEVRRDILALISRRSNQENYLRLFPILQRECFNKDETIRVSAIHAFAGILYCGRGRDAWLPNDDFESGILFLSLLANSGDTPYPYWQRAAGRHLYKLGRSAILPAEMQEMFENGPQE